MAESKQSWAPTQMIWSALIAVVVWTGVGFNWFGFGFNWQTQSSAERVTSNAVTENLATICAAQARNAPDAAAALEKLAGLSTWKRREFVETAQWANMPGSESPQNGVAELCATKLIKT